MVYLAHSAAQTTKQLKKPSNTYSSFALLLLPIGNNFFSMPNSHGAPTTPLLKFCIFGRGTIYGNKRRRKKLLEEFGMLSTALICGIYGWHKIIWFSKTKKPTSGNYVARQGALHWKQYLSKVKIKLTSSISVSKKGISYGTCWIKVIGAKAGVTLAVNATNLITVGK